jgi:GNAT superfamily N-acetyltransferase
MLLHASGARSKSAQEPCEVDRLGLERDGHLVGLAELSFGYPAPGDAYLGLMLLLPKIRGQGVGRTFLAEVENIARGQGAPSLYLAVLDANPRGRAFWLREGFTPAAPPREITIGSRTHQAQRFGKRLD